MNTATATDLLNLSSAISELAKAVSILADPATQTKPKKAATDGPTERELSHADVIPLVQQLSEISRTKARAIVKKFGDKVTRVPLSDLPELKLAIEAALAKSQG